MSFPSKINSMKLRVSSGTPPNVVIREQEISTANIGSNSILITNTQMISDFNDKQPGTIFNPSILASYQDSSNEYNLVINGLSNYVPKQIIPNLYLAPLTKLTTDPSFNLTSSVITNSSGALTFTSSNTSVATISGSRVILVGGGTTTINVSLAESLDKVYFPATINATLTVNKVDPSLLLSDLTKLTTDPSFNLTSSVTTNSLGALTFTSSNPSVATISGSRVILVGGGTTTITVSIAETAIYNTKTITATLTVNRVDPSLLLSDLTKLTTDPSFNLTPITNSDGALTFEITESTPLLHNDNVATISGSSVTLVGGGTATITVSIAQTAIYNTKTTTATLTVNKVVPNLSLSFTNFSKLTTDDPFDLTDANLNLFSIDIIGPAFTFSNPVGDASIATISGSIVTLTGTAGSTVITVTTEETPKYQSVQDSDTLTVNSGIIPNEWNQRGIDIIGESYSNNSGYSVSLSADGTTVAIGAYANDNANGNNAGSTRIYNYIANQWIQLGQDIDGEAGDDYSGISVSLSADGTRVAIGAYLNNNTNGNYAGSTRVYDYNSNTNTWVKLGQDIDGEAGDDNSGYSVSLSADGTTVAIGAYGNDANGNEAGSTRVYKYIANQWNQLGQDIDGEAAGDWSGYSVSLSADGTIVAIGGIQDGNNDPGVSRVYQYNSNLNLWNQLGQDIDGEAAGDNSGVSVSLSADGTTVAIGAYGNDANGNDAGSTRVYKYIANQWNQLGQDIDGEAVGDNSGVSVSLSADGTIVAIGSYKNNDAGNRTGQTRIYEYNTTFNVWNQIGSDIEGKQVLEYSGYSVCISGDGTIVAIGAFGNNNANGNDAGATRVYYYLSQ
jgi:hypothetical protein